MAILAWILIFLMSLVLHELCHGLVANALGDPTAKRAGRLTLNPLKHVDPFWTLILPGLMLISTGGRFAIGMAKPVPVDFRRLGHPRQDMVWVALAGPAANILLAAIFNFILRFFPFEFLLYAIYFNLGLAIFNLIPIPPLDGSRMVTGLLPDRLAAAYLRLEPYGFLIILFLYFTRTLFFFIMPGIDFFCRLLGVPRLGVHF